MHGILRLLRACVFGSTRRLVAAGRPGAIDDQWRHLVGPPRERGVNGLVRRGTPGLVSTTTLTLENSRITPKSSLVPRL